jgi:hypothetical protein
LNDLVSHVTSPAEGLKEVRIVFDSENGPNHDLYDVGEIVKAEFGYKSLTSNLTDITTDMCIFQNQVHKNRSLSDDVQGAFPLRRPGWLPIREDVLKGFRNPSRGAHAGDTLRRKVVGMGSLGIIGRNVLKLTYRPLSHQLTDQEVRACDHLCNFLETKSLIAGNLHDNDGHFIWFKLAEWMLVDIIEKIGSSLDHTPWYFFPFSECVQLYFAVLFKECNIVASEYGYMKAYASPAFLTDLVPGAVMALIFGQLKLMSIPLAKMFPLVSDDAMVEEVLFHAIVPIEREARTPITSLDVTQKFQSSVDERIREVSLVSSHGGLCQPRLFRALVPTYKTFSEVLYQLGVRIPSARIIQISGHKVLQVRVSVDTPSSAREQTDNDLLLGQVKHQLQAIDGVTVLFDYRLPNDNQAQRLQGEVHERKIHFALRVNVLSLLCLVRRIAGMDGVHFEQVYELWNGW